jgi:hypothetical protein
MRNITIGRAIKFFVILMFGLGLISAGIQQRNCNIGKCSHVSTIDMDSSLVKNVRPLFEKLFFI